MGVTPLVGVWIEIDKTLDSILLSLNALPIYYLTNVLHNLEGKGFFW
ncbi:hypothetical protein [Bacillus cereus group sp. BceL179]|uniref:Uncharacterized protein n=1 Tax=Bacillus pacificus TaxID=2026187 RepID=A0A1Y5ZD39_9BACI|nr:hypothetical protein BACERE00193_00310 [Bacillus paranthracis]SMD86366.1 hypothetical protein BACERE00191_01613 [Bacillus pacificus]